MNRRLYDGGAGYVDPAVISEGFYSHTANMLDLNIIMSTGAWLLGLVQLVFIVNLFLSLKKGKATDRNPWQATTLEWQTSSPPPHGNFDTAIEVFHDPYEYSKPGESKDFTPQNQEI